MSSEAPITGVMLRDLVQCERRVHHDLHADPALRDGVSDFVRMLCDGGTVHEAAILAALPGVVLDLRTKPLARRASATLEVLGSTDADWVVGARLELRDRVGHPDLLRREDRVWHAGDVKSGGAFADDGRSPKSEYAVQVAHYAALLGDLGAGAADRAFVIGRDAVPAWYDLTAARGRGKGHWIEHAAELVGTARGIRDGSVATRGALSSACAMCHWKSACRRELDAADDLTLVAGLGRATRTAIETVAPTVAALAALDLAGGSVPGRGLPGVGALQLGRFRDRARLLVTPGAKPYARRELAVSRHARELHFDLESDPLNDGVVYLHGILVRDMGPDGDVERFVPFFADGVGGERDAFAAAYAFLTADPDAHVFYYSKFERTSYRQLQARYPDVCSPDDVETLFHPSRATDLLFDVVMPDTEWPTNSVGIKPLARSLGFSWRDKDASGAASIAWFHEYSETRDPAVRQRILDYNEDDCRATAALLDALITLPVGAPAWPADSDSAGVTGAGS